jgi:hypothetical protein
MVYAFFAMLNVTPIFFMFTMMLTYDNKLISVAKSRTSLKLNNK